MALSYHPGQGPTRYARLISGGGFGEVGVSKRDGKYYANGQDVSEEMLRTFIDDLQELLRA